jgi:uncharacterized damage-inducible protein DinB
MLPDYLRLLYDYNKWANRRFWGCIIQLSDAQFDAENDYSLGSIHHQVAHLMGVEYWWFIFMMTGDILFLTNEQKATRESIRETWDVLEKRVDAYLETITEGELNRLVKPPFWDSDEIDPPIPIYQAITQVMLHSTDHRAQLGAALHKVKGPSVAQDFLEYLSDKAQGH